MLLYQLSTRWFPLLVSRVEISYKRTLCIEMYSILEIITRCSEMESILEIFYLVLLFIICANLPAKVLLQIYTFGILSKFLASLMINNFPKRPSGELLYSIIKFKDVPVGLWHPPPLIWGRVLLYLQLPKGGCCSISNYLSWSCKITLILFAVWSR